MLKTVSSITNAIGALNFKGTWNASTNTPTIVSGVGVKGDYFVVSVAGSTTIDGISNWGVGDWITYNGSIWQRVEGGADLNGVNLSVSGTTTLSNLTASTALALNATKEVVSVANTGTGDNVLATSPTLVTPILGTPQSGDVANLTGTASININGTVGATTPDAGSFTTLNTSGQVVFNDAGADVDVRVEGDTDANLLFVDASTDSVGIGTNSPGEKFSVNGNISFGSGLLRTINAANVTASTGFVDITVSQLCAGFMMVQNRRFDDSNPTTFRTFSFFLNEGSRSIQQIHEFVVGAGAAFTATSPSNGVIRITNNYVLNSDIEVLLQYRNTGVI